MRVYNQFSICREVRRARVRVYLLRYLTHARQRVHERYGRGIDARHERAVDHVRAAYLLVLGLGGEALLLHARHVHHVALRQRYSAKHGATYSISKS